METLKKDGCVTIGIPTYNRAGTYLKATLDSVLAQTYKNLEIIISDNASTDTTEQVCREYATRDGRVKYIRQKTGITPTANFNVSRREARGDYFAQLCDDDILVPTFLEACVSELVAHPEAAVAMPKFMVFDDKKREVHYDPQLYIPGAMGLYERLKQYMLMYEANGKDMLMWGVWRREIASAYLFDESPFPDSPGWDFLDMSFVFEGLMRGTCAYVPEVLFFKRSRVAALDTPEKKMFVKRVFDTLVYSRLRRLPKPFFYRRMGTIWRCAALSYIQKIKLTFWNLFVMSRLFWDRKI